MLRAYTSQKFYQSSLIRASKIWFYWSHGWKFFVCVLLKAWLKHIKKFQTKFLGLDLLNIVGYILILVNYFRNSDLYCKHFGDELSLQKISSQNLLPRAFSSFQKAWLDRAKLFKTCGSRAKFRAEPRLDTPLQFREDVVSKTKLNVFLKFFEMELHQRSLRGVKKNL